MKKGYKICPHCGKEIKSIAIKCQYCLKFLDEEPEKKTKECPFCLNEIDINETICPYCDEILEKDNKIKSLFSSKGKEEEQKEEEEIIEKSNSSKKSSGGKLRRLLVVLYFLITIPIVFIAIVGIRNNTEVYSRGFYFRDFYKTFFRIIIVIIGYVIITDLFRRIASFVGNGSFSGFLNYKKIFTKHRLYVLILVLLVTTLGILDNYRTNKIKNACTGEGEIFQKDLTCVCEDNYELIGGKCEKSDLKKLDDAVLEYINNDYNLSKENLYRFYADRSRINDNESIILLIDTSIPGGSNPNVYTDKYADFTNCYEEVEGISSYVGQGYILAVEKLDGEYKINDFYKIPALEAYGNASALSYPYQNLKQNNYYFYGGEKPIDKQDENLVEQTNILKMRDLNGDGKDLEFLLINHYDLHCGINNFLALGYNPISKKIENYRFLYPSNYYSSWTTLDSDAQNRFIGGILKMHEYGGHGIECDESRDYVFNSKNNTFETKNYVVSKECGYN